MSTDLDAYYRAAGDRPEWALWGKASPTEGGAVPAHPLLCHMVDVAAVAEVLLRDVLPAGVHDRLVAAFGLDPKASLPWLSFVIALHDLGKATPAFQTKVDACKEHLRRGDFDVAPPLQARDHGTMGVVLVPPALESFGISEDLAFALGRAVAAHHGAFPTDHVAQLPTPRAERGGPTWSRAREGVVRELAVTCGVSDSPPSAERVSDWGAISLLAGVTSVADWVGSMAEHFVYALPQATLADYMPTARQRAQAALGSVGFRLRHTPADRSFRELFGFEPRPLQEAMTTVLAKVDSPFCAVVEAPMGEGKTEAALYVSHALRARGMHGGTYIGLPTQATANQMFDRLSAFLAATREDGERVGLMLLHGEAVFDARVRKLLAAVYGGASEALVCEGWFLNKKRSLLAPFGAGTVDQALLSVLRTKHAFVRQLGLAAKTVVLDEVHAYDTYTSTLLDRLVAWLGELGASVVILSATLPEARRHALLRAYSGGSAPSEATMPYPRVSVVTRGAEVAFATSIEGGRATSTVDLQWLSDEPGALELELRSAVAGGGCIGVIHNTVRRAQETYEALREGRTAGNIPADTQLLLLHARFPAGDRRGLEQRLVEALGKTGTRPPRMIVVGTQVLEQSLDVDFDRLYTDLAPVDLVLQRAGRLHRHARAGRPPAFSSARLGVVAPDGPPLTADLRTVGSVYDPYVLRRSLMLLRSLTRITLPADIDPLVQAVYSGEEPEEARAALAREREDLEKQRHEEQVLAKERAWPPPEANRDPFGDLLMPYEEDDERVAKMLRAETRLGDPTAEVVCLFGDLGAPGVVFADAARTRAVDLDAIPDARFVQQMADRTVRVASPGLVQAIERMDTPPAWRDVAPLRRRRPVVFRTTDPPQPTAVADFDLTLDRELGLVITRRSRSKEEA